MNESPICIKLTADEKDELERLARSLTAPYRAVVRAKTILLLAEDYSLSAVARLVGRQRRIVRKWAWRFIKKRLRGLADERRSGRPARFPPSVVAHLVKLACELPDEQRRSLSLWTCAELARALQRDGMVDKISPQWVQEILMSHKLKPWRTHYWLSPKTPRDEEFYRRTTIICELYTRPLGLHEVVYSVDEKTSIQPRPRKQKNKPAKPGGRPILVEHEYKRAGALNLLAAFNTRSGKAIGILRKRKRQVEFIELLEEIERVTPMSVALIHLICDNVSTHCGKLVRAWLKRHPRFRMYFTPVHCSWMNQVEQWFSILQRKRLTAANFASLEDLEQKMLAFIDEWNQQAHPFKWTTKSFEKVLAKTDRAAA